MLQVRKVRVGDVTLQSIRYPETPHVSERQGTDGVRLKAETHHPDRQNPEVARKFLDWASVHMNLGLANAVPPGKELMLVVADHPESNDFVGGLNDTSMKGYVNIPKDDFFSFTISGESLGEENDIELVFHGNEAHEFVRALLRWWFWYSEAPPVIGEFSPPALTILQECRNGVEVHPPPDRGPPNTPPSE